MQAASGFDVPSDSGVPYPPYPLTTPQSPPLLCGCSSLPFPRLPPSPTNAGLVLLPAGRLITATFGTHSASIGCRRSGPAPPR